ncbi:MAG: hypothetical protein LBH97_03725 [Treponema sp.]|jgi:N-acetylglucosamine kinase-like BadF-type ATPase|nr:hypothetical protein [Treponema sp.]
MGEYVIGLDAGGTKSHLALFDTTGTLIDFAHWGPLNHESLSGSYEQLEDELEQLLKKILSKNNITMKQVAYSALGMAGVDTKLQHSIESEMLRRLGFEKFTLVNDAFLGIPAGNPAGTGICAINGTGCTLAGVNKEGKTLQIGGVGFISADCGGGGYMGEMVISSVYSELFRKAEPTCMTPVLLKKLGISNKYDFVDKIYAKIEEESLDIAACSRMLFEAVIKNDKVAARILCDIGKSYAGGISCMIEEMNFSRDEDIFIVLAGSVFVKGEHPLLLDTLKETVSEAKPGYRIKYTLLDVPPVAGAVVWALNMLGDNGASYNKVCSQLRNR